MPRKARCFTREGIYRITSDCMLERGYLKRPAVRKVIREVMARAVIRYGHFLAGYGVTQKGIRICLRVKDGCVSPSRTVQYIKSKIAQRCNGMMGRTGPFWKERFAVALIKVDSKNQYRIR